jgi:broad specificity phosphatase PhoE
VTRTAVLVRHVAVEAAVEGLWIGGASDPDVDPTALEALRPALAELANRHPPDRVICSPQTRARSTAALLDRPIEIDDRLRERDFGVWEGRPTDECLDGVDRAWMTSTARWLDMPISGAETVAAVITRTAAVWHELIDDPTPCVWCVGHAGSLLGLVAAAHGLALAEVWETPLPRGGWVVLPRPDRLPR